MIMAMTSAYADNTENSYCVLDGDPDPPTERENSSGGVTGDDLSPYILRTFCIISVTTWQLTSRSNARFIFS